MVWSTEPFGSVAEHLDGGDDLAVARGPGVRAGAVHAGDPVSPGGGTHAVTSMEPEYIPIEHV